MSRKSDSYTMEDDKLRRWMRVFGMAASSVVLFVVFHELGWRLGSWVVGEVRSNLGWGITVRFAVGAFVAIAIVLSILWEVVLIRAGRRWLAFTVAIGLFTAMWIPDISYTPYRAALLISSGFFGLAIPFVSRWYFSNRRMRQSRAT